MPFITKKSFEKNIKVSKEYIKRIEEMEKPQQETYFHEDPNSIDGRVEKIRIDEKNKFQKHNYDSPQKIGIEFKKGIEKIIKSSKENIFGFISYDKIHTTDYGKINLKDLGEYLSIAEKTHCNFLINGNPLRRK